MGTRLERWEKEEGVMRKSGNSRGGVVARAALPNRARLEVAEAEMRVAKEEGKDGNAA